MKGIVSLSSADRVWLPSADIKLREAQQETFLRKRGTKRREIALDPFSADSRRIEEPFRLGGRKTGEPRRLEIGGGLVGALDQCGQFARWLGRQAETKIGRLLQAPLDRLVVAADQGLERRDHVADHIFRRVMEQGGKAPFV